MGPNCLFWTTFRDWPTDYCAGWCRKTRCPKRVRFLVIDASIVDCVCLPLKNQPSLPSLHPLCESSWRKRKEKSDKCFASTWVSGLPRSTATSIHPFVQYAKFTLLEISPCQCPIVKRSGVAYSCSYVLLLIPKTIGNRKRDCAWGGSEW